MINEVTKWQWELSGNGGKDFRGLIELTNIYENKIQDIRTSGWFLKNLLKVALLFNVLWLEAISCRTKIAGKS